MKKYLEIYEEIKQNIVNQAYKYKSKLPSKRVVAEKYGVSVITVEHAYELLCDEGYVKAVEKSGYFVQYKAGDYFSGDKSKSRSDDKDIFDSETESENIVNEDINDIFKDTEPLSIDVYARTARKVLSMNENEIYDKSPSFGNMRLRKAISAYLLRSRNIHVTPDRIVIGAGSEYLYKMIVSVLGIDKTYGIETPGYRRIKEVYESNFAKTDFLHLTADGIDSKDLWNTKADVLHVTPFRSYPTGVTASAGKKREYIKWSIENNGIIIEDDFESEFTTSRRAVDTIFSMDQNDKVIYVNTFSRTISPSVRTAYMLIPEAMKKTFESKIGLYSCPVATLEQLIVASLIENGDFERHINRVRRKLRLKNEKGQKND